MGFEVLSKVPHSIKPPQSALQQDLSCLSYGMDLVFHSALESTPSTRSNKAILSSCRKMRK